RSSPSRSSAMLLEVEGPPRGIRRVLRLLQAFLELPIEQLALLGLRFHLLAEARLALGRFRPERAQRRAKVSDGALGRRRLVRDDGAQLGIDRQLAVAARAHDRERGIGLRAITVARVERVCTSSYTRGSRRSDW